MKYCKKLEGDIVYLSPIHLDDLYQYTQWLNDLQITFRLGNASENISLQKEKEYLEQMCKEGHNYAIIEKETDTLLGNVSLFDINPIHRRAELGIFIGDTEKRGKQYGTEAMELLLAYGFKVLNLNNILIKEFEFNTQAIRAYTKLGFKEFGRRSQSYYLNGTYWDECYMEILEKDFKSNLLHDIFPQK